MKTKTVYKRPRRTLDDFKKECQGLSRHQLIALRHTLSSQRNEVKAELRAVSTSPAYRGAAREWAINECLRDRDRLTNEIGHVQFLLARMKRLKKGLKPTGIGDPSP